MLIWFRFHCAVKFLTLVGCFQLRPTMSGSNRSWLIWLKLNFSNRFRFKCLVTVMSCSVVSDQQLFGWLGSLKGLC